VNRAPEVVGLRVRPRHGRPRGRPVRPLLVLHLHLPPLHLDVEDGAPLRMVERGRTVKGAQEEGEGEDERDRLQAEAPADKSAMMLSVL
jgi:hypothetical protein